MTVITRYPPAPSGEIHIGNLRTMLFNYLLAAQNGGRVVLRFEDTNEEKSDVKYEQIAIDTLNELGLQYDVGPFRQSDRLDIYQKYLQQMLDKDLAYYAEESNDGSGQVIRFRNPNQEITFTDIVRGDITIDTTSFEDFIIARSFDSPLYHFTVVVDDMEMGITHILRGEDHITSTPRQILLIEALGGERPQYAHLPLIVGEDKKKLGKRHGATGWSAFREQGYLPSAFVNHLAFLGWNPGDDREIFTLDELVQEFDINKVGKNPAVYDYTKLDNINRQHLLQLDADYMAEQIVSFLPADVRQQFSDNPTMGEKIMQMVILERINKFGDVTAMADQGEFNMFFVRPKIDADLVQFKDDGLERGRELVSVVIEKLQNIDESNWNKDTLKEALWNWTGEVGRGSVLHPMRTVLSGEQQSPDPFTIAEIIGKSETIERLQTFTDL